jgi:hypothetical protein
MRSMTHSATTAVSMLALAIGLGQPVAAQQPPWPDGCSVGLPFYVQQGLDAIFLQACDAHDRCWAQCNGPSPPYLGLAHRNQCNLDFLADMESACIIESAAIAFPLGGFSTAQEFIENCTGVAATFYAAVSTSIATGIFWSAQCIRGCNPDGCANSGLPYPPTCGLGSGPGFCYLMGQPPPPPSPNLCSLINCRTDCDTPAGLICCPFGCTNNPCRLILGDHSPSRKPVLGQDTDEWEQMMGNCGC